MTQRLIERIPIPHSAAKADEPLSTCLWVGSFIEEAVERGYDEDELPPDAMRFADVWEYYGEYDNGGHAQYYENEEETRPRLKLMAQFLEQIGLTEHANLVSDFERAAIENEDVILELYAAGENGAVREMFCGFDDRFKDAEQSEGRLLDCLAQWLLHQRWIEVEEAEMPFDIVRLRQLIPDPPSHEERLAARMRRRTAENSGWLTAFALRFIDYRSARSSKKEG